MTCVSILALAAAASADCFVIGLNYGVKGVRIGNAANAFMSLVCFCGTLLSMLSGQAVGRALDPVWGEIAGGALFALLGLVMLRGALFPRRKAVRQHYSENPDIVDKDSSKVIELRESLFIGLLLCVNNIGIGIGGGIAGIPVLYAPLACGAFSFIFMKLGCVAGVRIANPRLSWTLEAVSALMILMLGLGTLLGIRG